MSPVCDHGLGPHTEARLASEQQEEPSSALPGDNLSGHGPGLQEMDCRVDSRETAVFQHLPQSLSAVVPG